MALRHRTTKLAWTLLALMGCSSPSHSPLSNEAMARFVAAGPILPELDADALGRSFLTTGPYTVARGDILTIRGPQALLNSAAEKPSPANGTSTHQSRVNAKASIVVPVIGLLGVEGLTLLEIETLIADTAHPKYLVERPSIIVQIEEYATTRIVIMGAVEKPGILELRHNQMSLYAALSAAGGIARSGNLVVGASRINIIGGAQGSSSKTVTLPVKGLNIPYADVKLTGGEHIEVERYEPSTFTVVGLVTKPGAHAYPPEVTYNLMQALGVAGGTITRANPPYATIFRRDVDGSILTATFTVRGDSAAASASIQIKPGDVISVQHTAGSWTRNFAAEVFRINVGYSPRVD